MYTPSTADVITTEKGPSKLLFLISGLFVLLLAFLIDKHIAMPSHIILFLGISFVAGLFLASLSRVDVILYITAAYIPFSNILAGDFSGAMTAVNFTNILTIIAIISWAVNSLTKNEKFYTRTSLDIPLLLFMFLSCMSLFRGNMYFDTGYIGAFIYPLKRWLTPMFFFFIFKNAIRTKAQMKTLTIIIMFVVFTAALMAAKDYINIGTVSTLDKARVGGILNQPNYLAAFFVYYMFLFAGFWLSNWTKIGYWFLLMPFMVCFRGIQVTFSRGGYIAFLGGAAAIAFFKNKLLFAAGLAVLVIALANPVILPKGIAYRMSQTFRNDRVFTTDVEDVVDRSSYRRILAWKGAAVMIKQHLLFGVGYGGFPYLIGSYAPVGFMDAHNTYILIAAEMGMPTLIIFLLVLLIIFINACILYYRVTDKFVKALALGFLGGFGGLLVANIFGGRLNSTELTSYFWILTALIFRAKELHKEGKIK
ncbi:O-antigen ligase family protein [Candidatus Omnitrophota bacterium]